MSDKMYIRKSKEDKPVVAICYDFDKTLSPDDMQAQGYIQSVGYDESGDFWKKSNSLAEDNEMDQNLAYMYLMKQESEGKVLFTRDKLEEYGSKVELFPGVEEWFERINNYGSTKDVIIEHYIISSGLREMIEGTSVAKKNVFEKIYASSFYYNDKNVAIWPAQVINYTNKTQFLFRIEKGVLDINDSGVNDYFPPEKIRVPFHNMIYIGDSDTDIPCMKLVTSRGGHSICVYSDEKKKDKVYKMMRDGRIRYFTEADYRENSELDILVKHIIDQTATNEVLENYHFKYKKEQIDSDKRTDENVRINNDLINKLDSSGSFAGTHTAIKELKKIKVWSKAEKEKLFSIALKNNQVRYILRDYDVREFYLGIASSEDDLKYMKDVMDILKD